MAPRHGGDHQSVGDSLRALLGADQHGEESSGAYQDLFETMPAALFISDEAGQLLDVNQAEIQEADAMAQLASLRRQTVETENLLSVLTGSNPRLIVRGREIENQIFPPTVPAGLPSSIPY